MEVSRADGRLGGTHITSQLHKGVVGEYLSSPDTLDSQVPGSRMGT